MRKSGPLFGNRLNVRVSVYRLAQRRQIQHTTAKYVTLRIIGLRHLKIQIRDLRNHWWRSANRHIVKPQLANHNGHHPTTALAFSWIINARAFRCDLQPFSPSVFINDRVDLHLHLDIKPHRFRYFGHRVAGARLTI